MKLLIAIPALNEEESIESIIERSLSSREYITAHSPITEVEVTVVSDGSTDRTVERAEKYAGRIGTVVFERNRGYGAAIKEAWNRSDADVLGFLDADGTCDPDFFAVLCSTLHTEHADVVLGSRLSPGSKMPLIRRLGNSLFAAMLSILSSQRVRDTASGMRVVRRSCLHRLLPLPDGLHFTPAMSARAMLSGDLKILEVNMPYHEREGESKLKIWKDGLRFLRVILEAAFLYRPSRPLGILGALCILLATGLMISPIMHYVNHRSFLEWMIYRFVVSNLLASVGILFFCARYIAERIVNITLLSKPGEKQNRRFLDRLFASRWFWFVPVGLVIFGTVLVIPSFLELVRTGATYEHWSRFIVMSFFFSTAFILIVIRLITYTLGLIDTQLEYLGSPRP